MLDEYADDLAAVGGHLYLSGVDAAAAQLRRSHKYACSCTAWASTPASASIRCSTDPERPALLPAVNR
ncbi:hypothetical protein CTI14_49505, partial [Methylobacterium radiotolerans]